MKQKTGGFTRTCCWPGATVCTQQHEWDTRAVSEKLHIYVVFLLLCCDWVHISCIFVYQCRMSCGGCGECWRICFSDSSARWVGFEEDQIFICGVVRFWIILSPSSSSSWTCACVLGVPQCMCVPGIVFCGWFRVSLGVIHVLSFHDCSSTGDFLHYYHIKTIQQRRFWVWVEY